jgi:carbon-monoxide dehydrogenase medium subunit
MKPPAFSYHVPATVDEALGLLGTLENARLLAGGQSLMPMLNMRFAFPDHLIDLNRIEALAGIAQAGTWLRIGAMTRQRDLEHSTLVRTRLPLMAEALTHVGHRQTRNRGTIGGSLCHLDPVAELVSVAAALDAEVEIAGPAGRRTLPFAAFPLGYMTPAIAPEEMMTALLIDLPPAGHGHAFVEFARRHGDFAIVSVAVLLQLDDNNRIASARITLGGVEAVPLHMAEAEALLIGRAPGTDLFGAAAALCRSVKAMEDPHVPAWYRQQLAVALTLRALGTAAARAAAHMAVHGAVRTPAHATDSD